MAVEQHGQDSVLTTFPHTHHKPAGLYSFPQDCLAVRTRCAARNAAWTDLAALGQWQLEAALGAYDPQDDEEEEIVELSLLLCVVIPRTDLCWLMRRREMDLTRRAKGMCLMSCF